MVPEHQLLPPPPMGIVQEGSPNRGMSTDDGIQKGLGLGTSCGYGVGGSIVALNLQTERLRAVGCK